MAYPIDSNDVQIRQLVDADDNLSEGMVVYNDAGTFRPADNAEAAPVYQVVGVIKEIGETLIATVRRIGDLHLANWEDATGETFLTAGAEYYLGLTGQLTSTRPSASGAKIISIGIAKSGTVLNVNPMFYGEIP